MLDNIQITNKNGDAIMVEPICYIQVKSTGKKYLLYTLNEKVDNDLTKIYVAEVDGGTGAQPIEQSEWDNLRKTMSKMSKKENVEDIEYLNMNGVNFVVGEAKKLGIPVLLKQVFKDEAAAKSIANVQNNSQSVGMFIDPSLVVEPQVQQTVNTTETSIFANPPKPVIEPTNQVVETPVVPTPVVPTVPVQENVINQQVPVQPVETSVVQPQVVQEPAMVTPVVVPTEPTMVQQPVVQQVPVQPVETPVVQPQVVQEPAMVTPVVVPTETPVIQQPVIENVVQPVEPTPVVTPEPTIEEIQSVVTPQPVVEAQPVVENNTVETNKITDQEALDAIEVLEKYIDQESKE